MCASIDRFDEPSLPAPVKLHLQIDGKWDGAERCRRGGLGLCNHRGNVNVGPRGEGLGAAGRRFEASVFADGGAEKSATGKGRGKEALKPRRLEPLSDPLSRRASGRVTARY